jgi:hypothetical protein
MTSHLKGFGLENFRVFKDYTWFDFIIIIENYSTKTTLF